ncbi:MAG: glutaminyl-peptide cyclotransferase [Sphingobacteriaceae bacterium]|nr:MAG: glutaminyl-peptide cyclotransferase [Sphingobacteriaceae bacterium]
MKNKLHLLLAAAILIIAACDKKENSSDTNLSISPEAGTSYKAGDEVTVKLTFPADTKPDSVVYLLDTIKLATKTDSSAISVKTDTMPLGIKAVTAKFYKSGQAQEVSTNFVLMAAKAPEVYTYVVEKVFPHDTSAYTEGLLYQDGYLYESTGLEGESDLRKVDLNTGKVVQRAIIDDIYFGEGSAIVGDKIVVLTYRSKIGFVYDKNTFKLLKTFNNNVGVEGWGMTFDGKKLYMDDSTNRIWFLDKDNYNQTGYIEVYDDKGAIDSINELEYIDGKIYANIYQSNNIIVIDPKTGAVLQTIDMTNLWPLNQRPAGFDSSDKVLNGIAWDAKGKRLFVTGKKWPHLYQIKVMKK